METKDTDNDNFSESWEPPSNWVPATAATPNNSVNNSSDESRSVYDDTPTTDTTSASHKSSSNKIEQEDESNTYDTYKPSWDTNEMLPSTRNGTLSKSEETFMHEINHSQKEDGLSTDNSKKENRIEIITEELDFTDLEIKLLSEFRFRQHCNNQLRKEVCNFDERERKCTLCGKKEDILKSKRLLKDFFKSILSEEIRYDPECLMLCKESETKSYLNSCLQNHNCVWGFHGDRLKVFAVDQNVLQKSVNILKMCIVKHDYSKEYADYKNAIQTGEFEDIKSEFQGKILVHDIASTLTIVHTSDITIKMNSFFSEMIKALNSKKQESLKLKSEYFVSFMFEKRTRDICKVKRERKVIIEKSVTEKSEILITSYTGSDPEKAVEDLAHLAQLRKTLVRICDESAPVLLSGSEGRNKLLEVENMCDCKIHCDFHPDNKAPEMIHSFLFHRKKLCVYLMRGNIANLPVDLMICPTDDSLSPVGVGCKISEEVSLQSSGELISTHAGKREIGHFNVTEVFGDELFNSIGYFAVVDQLNKSKRISYKQLVEIFKNAAKQGQQKVSLPGRLIDSQSNKETTMFLTDAIKQFLAEDRENSIEIFIFIDDVSLVKKIITTMNKNHHGDNGFHSCDYSSVQKSSKNNGRATKEPIAIIPELGDIENQNVGGIIYAASPDLQMEGGIAKKLKEKAGPNLQKACNAITEHASLGNVYITDGFNLYCKKIFHTILPIWTKQADICLRIMRLVLWRCLLHGEEFKLTSFALPVLGTGKLRYPVHKIIEVIQETVDNFSHLRESFYVKKIVVILRHNDRQLLKYFSDHRKNQRVLDDHLHDVIESCLPSPQGVTRVTLSSMPEEDSDFPRLYILDDEGEGVETITVDWRWDMKFFKFKLNTDVFIYNDKHFAKVIYDLLDKAEKKRITSVSLYIQGNRIHEKIEKIRECIILLNNGLEYLTEVQLYIPREELHRFSAKAVKGSTPEIEMPGSHIHGLPNLHVPAWRLQKFTCTTAVKIAIVGNHEDTIKATEKVKEFIQRQSK